MTYQPTPEQAAVIDACRAGTDLVVEAAAGAGKTSTLRMAAAGMTDRRVLYVAYNKAAAVEAQRSFPAHVRCSTIHSLAFGAVGRQYGHRLNTRVTAKTTAERLGIRSQVDLGRSLTITPTQLVRLASQTVDRFCQSSDPRPHARHVPPVPGMASVRDMVDLVAELEHAHDPAAADARTLLADADQSRRDLVAAVLPVAERMWADLQHPDGSAVQFTHDAYLKMFVLGEPSLPYDVVMLDEAQDSNPCRAQLVTSQQAQRIAIGDGCQQLYAWSGAVDALKTWPTDTRLYLTQSWRFGAAVAEQANAWLSLLDTDMQVQGNPHLDSQIVRVMPNPDAVLCRTNAGAIARVIAALETGRRPALVGGAKELLALAEAARDLKAGRRTYHPELWAFPSWMAVQEYAEEPAGSDLRVFVKLIEQHGPEDLIRALAACSDEQHADVVISTAHKSKGREWPSVLIADDYTEPVDDKGKPKPVEPADAMLAYVAVTRAKLELDRGGLAYIDKHVPVKAVA